MILSHTRILFGGLRRRDENLFMSVARSRRSDFPVSAGRPEEECRDGAIAFES